jgi:hypothetical protein
MFDNSSESLTLTTKERFAVCTYTTSELTRLFCDIHYYLFTLWALVSYSFPNLYLYIKYFKLRRAIENLHRLKARVVSTPETASQQKKGARALRDARTHETCVLINIFASFSTVVCTILGYGFLYDLGEYWSAVGWVSCK